MKLIVKQRKMLSYAVHKLKNILIYHIKLKQSNNKTSNYEMISVIPHKAFCEIFLCLISRFLFSQLDESVAHAISIHIFWEDNVNGKMSFPDGHRYL